MRRSLLYSYLAVAAFASGYATTIEPPERVLASRVVHAARTTAVAAEHDAPEARILFVGDMMFDRTIRAFGEAKGYDHLFSCLDETMGDADAVIGNLEGPVTTYDSVSMHKKVGEPGNTQFTFSPEAIAALSKSGFVAVSIGNNHIRDFGIEGIHMTRTALDGAGISYTGDPTDPSTAATHLMVNGVPLTLIAYNQFLGTKETTLNALREHENETTVVFAHWGDEYKPVTDYQRQLARLFVDAGADLVIGAHPHIVQVSEEISGVPVFYSLGNFIFDQYWMQPVRTGAVVSVLFTQEGIRGAAASPVTLMKDRRTCIQHHE